MHDIDKVLQEMEISENYGEMEYGDSYDKEYGYNELGSLSDEMELDLATELLSASSDQELDYFFGKKFFKKLRKSPAFKSATNIFKGLAKQALPMIGKAVGQYFGGPAGGMVGSTAGQMGANMMELDLEGLSQEDKELEIAKGLVSFAKATADKLNKIPLPRIDNNVVKDVVKDVAKTYAPGLYKMSSMDTGSSNSGRWVRRGRRIILYDV